ncbi:hypothetical protein BDV98DRAFT_9852 [Pterulicium gracile]|uniref:Uncharacterized protein n=1 Tax=Pterulicium gracile TaxID=1884261 RepID=A0A5C3QYM2_9AGAR|nr:hypothetical protein BDV98DRAFT_9852 [Pterula gracilis]
MILQVTGSKRVFVSAKGLHHLLLVSTSANPSVSASQSTSKNKAGPCMCSMCCRARREESTRGLLPELSSQHDILPIRHNHTASEQDWLPLAGSLDIDGANGERDVQQVAYPNANTQVSRGSTFHLTLGPCSCGMCRRKDKRSSQVLLFDQHPDPQRNCSPWPRDKKHEKQANHTALDGHE